MTVTLVCGDVYLDVGNSFWGEFVRSCIRAAIAFLESPQATPSKPVTTSPPTNLEKRLLEKEILSAEESEEERRKWYLEYRAEAIKELKTWIKVDPDSKREYTISSRDIQNTFSLRKVDLYGVYKIVTMDELTTAGEAQDMLQAYLYIQPFDKEGQNKYDDSTLGQRFVQVLEESVKTGKVISG